MKLHVLSDLHVEFGDLSVPNTEADLIILAGDIHVGCKGLKWVSAQGFEAPIIYVLGNHEFYRDAFPDLIGHLKQEAEATNVHVLENDSVEFDGLRFFGCTLWSDMNLFGDPRAAMTVAAGGMNDYQLIRNSQTQRRLTPDETVSWHKHSFEKLGEFLKTGDPGRSVVVTHSLPSIRSIPERYRDHSLAPAFASNMESLIHERGPLLWVHGHTHDSFDYRIGNTRIVCNPRGYVPDACNPAFDEELIVEV